MNEGNKMKVLHDPVETLRKEIQTWDAPFVEPDCFGTDSAVRIVEIMDHLALSRARQDGLKRKHLALSAKDGRRSPFARTEPLK